MIKDFAILDYNGVCFKNETRVYVDSLGEISSYIEPIAGLEKLEMITKSEVIIYATGILSVILKGVIIIFIHNIVLSLRERELYYAIIIKSLFKINS